jgi:hypothetical protein
MLAPALLDRQRASAAACSTTAAHPKTIGNATPVRTHAAPIPSSARRTSAILVGTRVRLSTIGPSTALPTAPGKNLNPTNPTASAPPTLICVDAERSHECPLGEAQHRERLKQAAQPTVIYKLADTHSPVDHAVPSARGAFKADAPGVAVPAAYTRHRTGAIDRVCDGLVIGSV